MTNAPRDRDRGLTNTGNVLDSRRKKGRWAEELGKQQFENEDARTPAMRPTQGGKNGRRNPSGNWGWISNEDEGLYRAVFIRSQEP